MPFAFVSAFRSRIRPRHSPPGRPPDPPPPGASALALDGLHTALELLRDSTDVFPPLKSSIGAVLGLWDLTERVQRTGDQVAALASRASSILLAINNAATADPVLAAKLSLSPLVLRPIEELYTTLDGILRSLADIPMKGSKRLQYLRRNEDRLAKLTADLVSAHETFIVGMHTAQAIYTLNVNDTTTLISANVFNVSTSLDVVTVELSKLRTQVQYLQLTVVFLD